MILVVEDDEDVREMLAFTLTNRGYRVETVTGGSGALGVLERTRPCLVLLDLVMPGMTGQDVLAQMRARGLTDIPVCVMSALGPTSPPADAVGAIRKPFETSEILAMAARYCAHVGATTTRRD